MEKSTVISSAVSLKTAAASLLHNTSTYDAKNVELSHFSSDKNKGSQSIAEIRCSVIKPLITDSMA